MTRNIKAWSRRGFVVLILLGMFLSMAPRQAAAATTTWKTLVLVYRSTDVTYVEGGVTQRLRTSMTSADVNAAVSAVKRTPGTVYDWSANQATMRMKVVYPDHPVRRVSLHANRDYGYWLSPADMAADLDRYAPAGTYDSVIVIWRKDTDAGQVVPGTGWGWTTADRTHTNGAFYTSVTQLPNHRGWPGAYPEEVFVHEWLHQVEGFYGWNKGFPLPGLHDTDRYGYTAVDGSWNKWYRDYMRGKVWDGSRYLGMTSTAWASSTPTSTSSYRNYAPTAGAMTLSTGTSPVGSQVTLQMTYSDPNGWRNINWATAVLRDPNGRPTVQVLYNQNRNKMYLRKIGSSAWTGGYAPGTALTLSQQHVSVNLKSSSVSGSGNTLTVRWAFTFQSGAQGADYKATARVTDDILINSNLKAVGWRNVR